MLNEFVEKILVHERARKGSQDTTQEVEIYFNFVGRYIPPALQPVPLTPEEQKNCGRRRNARTGFTRTTCAASKRQAEGMGRTLQRQAQGPGGGGKGRDPGRGHGKRHFYPCRSATQAGAAQGHLTGQRRSLTITVQRRTNMNELTYNPLRGLLHPRPETVRAAGGPHRQVWPYAATLPEGTPARPLQQFDFE